jgi:hypothetical protein
MRQPGCSYNDCAEEAKLDQVVSRIVLSLFADLAYLKTPNAALFLKENLTN